MLEGFQPGPPAILGTCSRNQNWDRKIGIPVWDVGTTAGILTHEYVSGPLFSVSQLKFIRDLHYADSLLMFIIKYSNNKNIYFH